MKDRKIADLQLMCEDIYDDEPFGDKSYLNLMMEHFMKKLYIYPFDTVKASSRKSTTLKPVSKYDDGLITSDSDDEYDPIEPLAFDDFLDEGDVKHYRISFKKSLKDVTYVDYVYVRDVNHKKFICSRIEKYAATKWKDVYKISIQDLKFKARKCFTKVKTCL